ncbi:MAG: flagellar hook-length control protein FliK, partial [Campylobacterota bacterium]|nr:flagellar hook-length control protein FliK [Campylobacterota bacterium]
VKEKVEIAKNKVDNSSENNNISNTKKVEVAVDKIKDKETVVEEKIEIKKETKNISELDSEDLSADEKLVEKPVDSKNTKTIEKELNIKNLNQVVDNIVENNFEKKDKTTTDLSESSIKTVETKSAEVSKNPLMANMFLSAQKNLREIISKEQVSNAKKNLEENKTISGVKKSAQMLDLNLKDAKIKVDETKVDENAIKKDTSKPFISNSNSMLNKMVMQTQVTQGLAKESIENSKTQEKTISTETATIKEKETTVSMTVPPVVVETIQNKIIGAQQKVGTFMSDVARNMYLNYKPPVNTFKIDLNPANLGSISIIMRSNKADNSISVSMNMSNSSTMDVFSENKSSLQSAIARNFNDGSSVNLSFDMQGDSSQNSFEQFKENQNNQQKGDQQDSTSGSHENEEEVVAENNDYM